ncbi:nucleotidyltransferase family protein [Ensifer adhaerens]|uniref:nucleotidyltransferase family protein n=1 Tax=Ensifer adhaerens TaxID=106592 RepID=UPI001CC17A86|nr:nucleotidyltransferase family protein [Ensifer adhaerens]MBZ7925832.1 nucleotidyltransferase family protein [Ensifer adhaerens]
MRMKSAKNPLDALITGLHGRVADRLDWPAVMALANQTLLTPALFASLEQAGAIEHVPNDVREYLHFIRDCNRERNMRLRSQLNEAIAALNAMGVAPVLLKGAIPLFLSQTVPDRITSDIDLAVAARDEPLAQACLEELGYVCLSDGRGMVRDQDVGVLELRPYRADGFGRPKLVQRGELLVKIASPQSRALHWIVHDLLKEGDYWRGRIDLRHLYDLAQLAESEPVDWAALRGALQGKSARNAIETQLLTLNRFFGTSIPLGFGASPTIRFQHWRRVFASSHPILGAPLRLAGNLYWGARRFSRVHDLARRDPIHLARRITTVLLNKDLRSKI